jgi:CspA family cold shock protein
MSAFKPSDRAKELTPRRKFRAVYRRHSPALATILGYENFFDQTGFMMNGWGAPSRGGWSDESDSRRWAGSASIAMSEGRWPIVGGIGDARRAIRLVVLALSFGQGAERVELGLAPLKNARPHVSWLSSSFWPIFLAPVVAQATRRAHDTSSSTSIQQKRDASLARAFARFARKGKTMQIGTVKWFNAQRGFGFIQPDDGGKDVFVHVSAVERAGMRDLQEGQKIRFDVLADSRSGKSSAGNLVAA